MQTFQFCRQLHELYSDHCGNLFFFLCKDNVHFCPWRRTHHQFLLSELQKGCEYICHVSSLLIIFTCFFFFYIYTLWILLFFQKKMVAKMSICERWEFEPSLASPLKGQTASLWQRLHCCVRRPCQPRTEATRRSADGILHSVSLVPMVLQVCFRRDCNCEPGHVLLVSLTPSQPYFPAACLHLHLCTYASTVTLWGIYAI